MYRISFERPCSKCIAATYTIFDREHTGVDLKDIKKFRYIKDILTLLKFTLNEYHPLTVMHWISFEQPRSKSITSTYTIFSVKVY